MHSRSDALVIFVVDHRAACASVSAGAGPPRLLPRGRLHKRGRRALNGRLAARHGAASGEANGVSRFGQPARKRQAVKSQPRDPEAFKANYAAKMAEEQIQEMETMSSEYTIPSELQAGSK